MDYSVGREGPSAKRRCSILRAPNIERRLSPKAVSFSDRCFFKNLDGSCEISRLFLQEEMELTLLDVVEPIAANYGQYEDSDMDISTCPDRTSDRTSDRGMDRRTSDRSLDRTSERTSDMTIDPTSDISIDRTPERNSDQILDRTTDRTMHLVTDRTMDRTTDKTMHLVTDRTMDRTTDKIMDRTTDRTMDRTTDRTIDRTEQISDISSFSATLDGSFNDTLYGAFEASNLHSSTDTIVQNIEALNDCIHDIDKATDENRRRLDDEIANLLRFYRHIVSKDNKYEFAISIFGLRHSLWLIFKVNPDTYPNEKLNLKFAVHKSDRRLYPFYEFAESVRRTTQEGRHAYLTRFVINAQRFRRFLATTYSKTKNETKN